MTRQIGLGSALGLALLLTFACGEEDKGGEESTASGVQTVDVCATELAGECGDPCTTTTNCPSGQHCSEAGMCTAQCTPTSGCNGECRADGTCNGTLQVIVVGPPGGGGADDPVIFDPDEPGGGGGGSSDFTQCATSSASGEFSPVAMYVMFDRSSSMQQEVAGTTRWLLASSALVQFFQDPGSADLGVAYGVFPGDANGCSSMGCSADACADPVVEVGTLTAAAGDPHEAALVNAVESDPGRLEEGLGTPTSIALEGALDWATDYQASNGGHSATVVLVTDGEPSACDPQDIGSIAALAAGALDASGIRTYAIGLTGSREGDMDQIARAGGTGEGIFIGDGTNAGQELLSALSQIRGEVASCDLQVPDPPNGETLNKNQVNVELTLDGEPVVLAQVNGADQCGDDAGWFYNNDDSRILICPAACDAIQNDPAAQIDIVLGCNSNQIPPSIAR